MSDKINVAVVGPIPHDRITTHLGHTIEKFGCAIYTSVVLSSLAGAGSIIYNVSHVRKSDITKVQALLSEFPHLDVSNVTCHADQGDSINLIYVDQNKRLEKQTGFMNPILPADLKELMGKVEQIS